MTVGRFFRTNAGFVLLTLLLVPALTQPARRLSPRPADQSSSFSRLGVLSTDRVPTATCDIAVLDAVVVALFVPPASATPTPATPAARVLIVDFGPPSLLRAPPILAIS